MRFVKGYWLLLLWMSVTLVNAEVFKVGDQAFICVQYSVNPNWSEYFALKVEVVKELEHRMKVKVINDYPMPGRTNEEEVPVLGDLLKVSKAKLYSQSSAGVRPGARFEGKPVCSKLMPEPTQ